MSELSNDEIRTEGRRRRRFTPVVLLSGVAATALLSLTLTGTLAGFTAQITNSTNTAATGTVVMQEQNATATVTCTSTDLGSISTNASTCSTINKYGGSTVMVPGTPVSTTVTIKNVGTAPANTFTLTPGTCTQSNNGALNGSALDLCTKLGVVITQTVSGTTTTITPVNSTLTSLASGGALTLTAPVAAGATVSFTFTVTLASAAGNTYQGLAASQPLVWQFSS